ncbi:MAG TPA: S1 RNA-binding domain-containing protein, partial [Pyrinomonadaceae bacterium]|nr:S1 RNA-binding domain-containing protein [Pyrinomonadaceae bacterium]
MQSEETKQTAEATATEQPEAPAAEQTNDNNTAAETPAASTQDTTGTATTEAPAAETAAQGAPAAESANDPAPATAEQPTVAANEQPTQATATETSATTGADDHSGGEMDFGAMLEQFEQEQARYREGDLVEGKVISVSDRGVVIDFGYKSEGVVKSEELMENGEVTVK